jgi:hypothetical protein
MPNQQGKKDTKNIEELSETAKTTLLSIWIEHIYGRTKEFTSKFTEKGNSVEEDAFDIYSLVKSELFVKNKETFSNEYFIGTPDHKKFDIKAPWDIHNFFGVIVKPMNKDYVYQLNAYMDLTGESVMSLVYVLCNTPEKLIEDEKKRLAWRMATIDPSTDEAFQMASAEVEKNCIFNDIPNEKRYIEFEIIKDEALLESVKNRVPIWREFLNMLPK